jgi:hypothetical protein
MNFPVAFVSTVDHPLGCQHKLPFNLEFNFGREDRSVRIICSNKRRDTVVAYDHTSCFCVCSLRLKTSYSQKCTKVLS